MQPPHSLPAEQPRATWAGVSAPARTTARIRRAETALQWQIIIGRIVALLRMKINTRIKKTMCKHTQRAVMAHWATFVPMKTRTRWAQIGLATILLAGCGYNSIQGADEDVKAGWAEVQNQYQRRLDLVPNLVNTVKGAADFERDTLQAVIEARSQAAGLKMDASLLDDPQAFARFQQAQDSLGSALQRLMVVVERYPDIKSTAAFRDLQAQLEGTENRIAVARKRYIETVSGYNKLVRQFPTNLTARYILGVDVRPSFEASAAAAEPPEVQF